jgi:hypothetical protein
MVSGKQAKKRRRQATTRGAAAPSSRRLPGVVAEGWAHSEVVTRHLGYARALVDAGVTFEQLRSDDRAAVQHLVDEHIQGRAGAISDEAWSPATLRVS